MRDDVQDLIAEGSQRVGTAEEGAWFDELDRRRGEVEAVVEEALARRDGGAVVRLGAALWPYSLRRAADGSAWLERVAGATQDEAASVELVELRYGAGLAAFRRGDNDVSRRLNEESLDAAAVVGSDRGRSRALIGLSRVAFRDGDYQRGTELAHQAGGIARACGDEAETLLALHMEAELARASGDYAAARPLYERLLEADRATGDDRGLAMELGNLGSVLVQVGELNRAEACLREALHRAVAAGAIDQLPYCLLGLGGLGARRHDPHRAGRLIGAVEAFLDAGGQILDPAEQLELATHVEAGQAAGETFDDARAAGRQLTIDTAVRELLDE